METFAKFLISQHWPNISWFIVFFPHNISPKVDINSKFWWKLPFKKLKIKLPNLAHFHFLRGRESPQVCLGKMLSSEGSFFQVYHLLLFLYFSFIICPQPDLLFSQKGWMMPRHILMLLFKNFGPYYAHSGAVMGSTTMCLGILSRSWTEKWAAREKRSICTFALPAIRTLLLI